MSASQPMGARTVHAGVVNQNVHPLQAASTCRNIFGRPWIGNIRQNGDGFAPLLFDGLINESAVRDGSRSLIATLRRFGQGQCNAAPRPELPPVTRARLPSSLIFMNLLGVYGLRLCSLVFCLRGLPFDGQLNNIRRKTECSGPAYGHFKLAD